MGHRIDKKIAGILRQISVKQKPKKQYRLPYVTLIGKNKYDTREMIRKDLEDSMRFVAHVMGYSDIMSLWQMDVFEFHRDIVRAHRIQEHQIEQLKKQQDGRR